MPAITSFFSSAFFTRRTSPIWMFFVLWTLGSVSIQVFLVSRTYRSASMRTFLIWRTSGSVSFRGFLACRASGSVSFRFPPSRIFSFNNNLCWETGWNNDWLIGKMFLFDLQCSCWCSWCHLCRFVSKTFHNFRFWTTTFLNYLKGFFIQTVRIFRNFVILNMINS